MADPIHVRQRLLELTRHLDRLNRAWTPQDYALLISFFVETLPGAFGAERCGIFIHEPGSENVWLRFGTALTERQIGVPQGSGVVGTAIASNRTIIQNDLAERTGVHTIIDQKTDFTTRSILCVPIPGLTNDTPIGAIELLNHQSGRFVSADADRLQRVVKFLSLAMESGLVHQEMAELSALMEREASGRMEEVLPGMVVKSARSREMVELALRVSPYPIPVLITGESGTGKELIARIIHQNSPRREGPLVAVNCAAIPEGLVESEFFGHEKGAFTGAHQSRPGRFEAAAAGTLFLDEVGEMPMPMQAKFLRAIQEMEGTRLGGRGTIKYDFRLICATRSDLRKAVTEGRFRDDLLYRLFSVDILMPPLRERREEIAPMALAFLDRTRQRFNKPVAGFTPDVLRLLEEYNWPGNVRELENEVERLVALTPDGGWISRDSSSSKFFVTPDGTPTENLPGSLLLSENRRHMETRLIKKALIASGGNKMKAAQYLGVTRQSLFNKIRQYGINRDSTESE